MCRAMHGDDAHRCELSIGGDGSKGSVSGVSSVSGKGDGEGGMQEGDGSEGNFGGIGGVGGAGDGDGGMPKRGESCKSSFSPSSLRRSTSHFHFCAFMVCLAGGRESICGEAAGGVQPRALMVALVVQAEAVVLDSSGEVRWMQHWRPVVRIGAQGNRKERFHVDLWCSRLPRGR